MEATQQEKTVDEEIFVLDFYCDAIKRTTRLKWEQHLRSFPSTKSAIFVSMDDACDALVQRAVKALEDAKLNVKWAEKRVTKCRKYYRTHAADRVVIYEPAPVTRENGEGSK